MTTEHLSRSPLGRDELAALVARSIPDGAYVNLGIGRPTDVAEHLRPASGVVLHTENGMLGMGSRALGDDVDVDLLNAGKVPVLETAGASYFDHAQSFAMMRGGHIDVCVLGAFQVAADGTLANWSTGEPGAIPAVGGAMDLAVGAKQVFALMTLFDKTGAPKLVPTCSYPVTGLRCVTQIFTDLAHLAVTERGIEVVETFGTSRDALQERLDVPLLNTG